MIFDIQHAIENIMSVSDKNTPSSLLIVGG
jgi:hypothetical protein